MINFRIRHSAHRLKRMECALILFLTVVLLSFAHVQAVNGISVYHDRVNNREWPLSAPGGDLWVVHIENNQPVKSTMLLDAKGGSAETKARNPVINVSGTKIAFFTNIGNTKTYVTIANIDGADQKDIAELPSGDGYNGKGFLNWPVGDWIYYSCGGDKSAGSKELWRVNVNPPHTNESYATFDQEIWQTQMSADAKRMHITKSGTGRYAVALQPEAISLSDDNSVGGGCGAALSPSGLWRLNYNNAEHTDLIFVNWSTGAKTTFNIPDYNAWSVTQELAIICKGITITVGGGHNDAPRFSANSDKWIVTGRGWPGNPNMGRYSSCGRNQVLINWVDKIAVPATRHLRSCSSDDYCSNSQVSDSTHYLESGHFWISAPLEDINEDLRQYVSGSSPASVIPHQTRHSNAITPAATSSYTIHGRKLRHGSSRNHLVILQNVTGQGQIMLDIR